MKACAERVAVDEAECVGAVRPVGGNNLQVSDANGARPDDPDGAVIATACWRQLQVRGDVARQSRGIDAIGHDGGDPAVDWFDVERSELHESIERTLTWVVEIDAIWHWPDYRCVRETDPKCRFDSVAS